MSPEGLSGLLSASMAAHLEYRLALQNSDPITQRDALQRAFDLRAEADTSDPQHTDPAWSAKLPSGGTNRDMHDALMLLYRELLAR